MTTLRELYLTHVGKIADKWTLFLDVYERIFARFRDKPLALVEVGVANGGSLELWARYFAAATVVIGCDVDPKCGSLRFEDRRIGVVVGAVNSAPAYKEITDKAPTFDLFIDDGSHTSRDIVLSFLNYFPRLKPGGLYVIEDLHCSYLAGFGGGIDRPDSSMAFLKTLADFVNRPYWERDKPPATLLAPVFGANHAVDPALFSSIFAIAFYDSLCVIEKRSAEDQPGLGDRVMVGNEASVFPKALALQAEENARKA
ncbi:class I SAM-dependent methyltransferase [Usitatibacter palustris]|uniref:8-demethyl-8-alpha-L-rhamnosyl tetracenomycin-C 2'-O-methyltransferase n=1 Tax=Usitatibacter palustris TaxID=2732487 RepID=A0A6M4HCF6_9PROT|nr:class I SAM-dependent methyltransferase [Usitatibacter palustris]QJR15687.1 8-demethyl-8-alpha-L-rhamnosyl tetracenomycin-C 2'-O-methyltransferase [Usitatibacter palustris]